MRRNTIKFDEFKKNFIDQPDGFFPVYSAIEENGDWEGEGAGQYFKVIQIDMICEWRLTDGQVKFLAVPFENEQQFNEIMAYLRVTADLLNKAILNRVSKMSFADILEV